jgi:phosphohistidine phosphatase
MKQILLMRHAKSSWEDGSLKDFDRPLNKRGQKDAPMMGEFIRQIGYKPAAIIASPASRAKQTTQLSMKAAKVDEDDIYWNEDLYYGSMRDYIAAIQSVENKVERLLLIGHNPLIENTAGILAGSEHKTAIRMPTAALVCLESFAEKWEQVSPGTCQIKWMMIPKVLKEMI